MTAITEYNRLSLNWSPENKTDFRFKVILLTVLTIVLATGFLASTIILPPQVRTVQTIVPERIAKFLTENRKPKTVQPKQKPLPLPKPRLKLRVKKQPPNKTTKNKALTKAMKKARKKAEISGLLALNSELADLMDTNVISTMVSGRRSKGSAKAISLDNSILARDMNSGSGGIGEKTQILTTSRTKLSNKELSNFRASLLANNTVSKPVRRAAAKASIRLEEQVTITFDQNKSKLYSLYNRARRKNPGLKGKLILEITIAASGEVENVKIVVSELNDPSLERRIIARVKQFKFGHSGEEKITVTFPIEFIPS